MRAGNRVLIVDDVVDLLDALAGFLTDVGLQVKTAVNGYEGLAVASAWKPDVILLDLVMPVLDGRAFLQRLQTDPVLARIPVIVMSASPTADARDEPVTAAAHLASPSTSTTCCPSSKRSELQIVHEILGAASVPEILVWALAHFDAREWALAPSRCRH